MLALGVLVFSAPLATIANDKILPDGLTADSLSAFYQKRIEQLELEIHNETRRRTTIIGQLDSAISEFKTLNAETDNTSISAPQIDSNLQEIKRQLSSVDDNIEYNTALLNELDEALKTYPRPTVWQAALGNPELLQQQKFLATQRYLVHTTKNQLQYLENQKRQLNKKHQTFVEFEKGLSDSIRTLRQKSVESVEQSKDLEFQLAKVASDIVKKQNRIRQLSKRSKQLISDPAALKFSGLKKQLPDPVDGELLKSFAQPKAKGLLKWNGLLVSAPLGQAFTAVSDGLIVFADEIHGLGKVAIIDHGDGYMSLYGMAELLMVEANQIVLTGDPLGTVGESVGLGTSALYFEIRHNADTLDPQDWLVMHRISQKGKL